MKKEIALTDIKTPKDVETENALRAFCTKYIQSGLAPKGASVDKLMLSVSKGAALGIPPMAAAYAIYSINNQAEPNTDAMFAVVAKSGLLEDFTIEYSGEGENLTCTWMLKRKGMSSSYFSFSIADARQAGLFHNDLKPDVPWKKYPKRMLRARAGGYGLQDTFSDVLMGLYQNQTIVSSSEDQSLKDVTEVLEQHIGGELELHHTEEVEEIFIFKGLNNNEISKKRSEVHKYLLKVINAITSPEKFKHYQKWSRINWDEMQRYGNLEPNSWKILSSEYMSKKSEDNINKINNEEYQKNSNSN